MKQGQNLGHLTAVKLTSTFCTQWKVLASVTRRLAGVSFTISGGQNFLKLNLFIKKTFPLDGQTRWTNLFSQPLNLPFMKHLTCGKLVHLLGQCDSVSQLVVR